MRYVEVNLMSTPVGSGTRSFIIVEERGRRARLLYVPMLRAFWLDARLLKGTRDLPTRGLAARIRRVRRERNLLNLSYSGPAVRLALELLREGQAPSPEEESDDALWGAREVDDETSTEPNEGDDNMDDLNKALDPSAPASPAAAGQPAQPAKAAAPKPVAKAAAPTKGKKPAKAAPASKGAAAVADPRISGRPVPSPNAAAAAPAAKNGKAAAPAKEKKVKAGGRAKWAGTEKIKVLAKENPSREGSRLHKLFSELRDGMTVKEAQAKMKSKHSVDEGVTVAMLRHMQSWEKVRVSA